MSSMIKFEDYTSKVVDKLDQSVQQWLVEASGEVVSAVQRNTRVDTGQLKGSWNYKIQNESSMIGSPLQNAVWEEYGTGQYSVQGGRKTPWKYKDRHGIWHTTTGKRPQRALEKAFTTTKPKLKQRLEELLKGLGT